MRIPSKLHQQLHKLSRPEKSPEDTKLKASFSIGWIPKCGIICTYHTGLNKNRIGRSCRCILIYMLPLPYLQIPYKMQQVGVHGRVPCVIMCVYYYYIYICMMNAFGCLIGIFRVMSWRNQLSPKAWTPCTPLPKEDATDGTIRVESRGIEKCSPKMQMLLVLQGFLMAVSVYV